METSQEQVYAPEQMFRKRHCARHTALTTN